MPLPDRPIGERIEALLALAHEHADTFCSPSAWLSRERYLANHPTRIMAMKCMDGRIHLPLATQTPLGIIKPFRNLGGIFNLGWPHLSEVLTDAVGDAIRGGHGVLLIISYHFSRGDPARGCAGFACNVDAALAHVHEIRRQAERIFGSDHQNLYPLVCGF